ncbi:MAG: cobalamin-dependent protein [Coriobacteriia bacterium]|nr:cobalamin-dependent protein [Coriobacteriia bacterium]MBN2823426.1 cobalamin-dependent protein [Coriobacteriia bacterium]
MPAEPYDLEARTGALLETIDNLIRKRDHDGAIDAATRAIGDGIVTVPELYTLVLSPLMVLTGARWQKGDVSVWEEHYTTATVRTIVESLSPVVRGRAAETTPNGHTVVLACPEEEYHDLGLRMLADRFTLAGYRTHFLGAALPLQELLSAIRGLAADTVVLSASTHFHRLQVREYVDAIRAAQPDVRVLVGGAAFARGHDGWDDADIPDLNALLGDVVLGA